MEFKKYQHIERFGTSEVDGIECGECCIFHKIDGTCSQVWLDDNGNVNAGSRKRKLTLAEDNAGFFAYIVKHENIKKYLQKYPYHRLYGEFLVPHSLRTYRSDAWNKFYIFDVCIDKDDNTVEYIPYDIYKPMFEEFSLDYIPAIAKVTNPTYELLIKYLEKTGEFLIEDGKGTREGIVVKNYSFYNKFGRQTWAKIITDEFTDKSTKKVMPEPLRVVEEDIVNQFCTKSFIEKEFAKVKNSRAGWQSKYIPELLSRVFSELVKEEMWNIIKKYRYPKINFKTLNTLVVQKVKEVKKEIFS